MNSWALALSALVLVPGADRLHARELGSAHVRPDAEVRDARDGARVRFIGAAWVSGRIELIHSVPPRPWDYQDSAYFYYDRALSALDADDFRLAAHYFARIHQQFPSSTYAPDSWYWEAFSLYRLGGASNLRAAVVALELQQRLHSGARTASDGVVLATQLRGELAKAGDSGALRELHNAIRNSSECANSGAAVKLAALSALNVVDPPAAIRYVRDIHRNSAVCSRGLRAQTVFVLAQIRSPESDDLIISLARDSDELDVRVEAVQWLGDMLDPRATDVLVSILLAPSATRLKEVAVEALSHSPIWADPTIFRQLATSRFMPVSVRVPAVQWLAAQRLHDQSDLLKRIFEYESEQGVRDAIVTAIAGQRNVADKYWLLSAARDSTLSLGSRRAAVTAAAPSSAPAELYDMYLAVNQEPLREHIIELLGRHKEPVAVQHLISIATRERSAQLRGSSLHWLRQSANPAAVAFVRTHREH